MKNFKQKTITLTFILLLIYSTNKGATIYSTLSGGLWNVETTWIGDVIPGENDTAIVQGSVIVGHVSGYDIFHSYGGWVIVEPTGHLLPHEYGGGLGTFILYVEHDIINNGKLTNAFGSKNEELLKINVKGDVTNNNYWRAYQTDLTGTGNQNLSLAAGKTFGGWWVRNSTHPITAQSDLWFDCIYSYQGDWLTGDFNLNGSTLHMGNYSIRSTGTIIYNGTIEGDFEILGIFSVNTNNTDTLRFEGTVTVTDTLQSDEFFQGYGIQKLLITGDIINNGLVRDRKDTDNADDLNILITGNIENNGKWTCNYVNFVGTETQYITQSPGTQFVSNFYDLDAGSMVVGESDIEITLNFDLNGSTLDMQNHTLQMGGWLHDGNIDNTNLRNGYLQDLSSLDNLIIEGTVTCDDGNIFQNSVIVNDTLRANEYSQGTKYFDLYIDGDLVNNGLIRNSISDDRLRMYISGDITNNGQWLHDETIFNGSADQVLQQGEGNFFGGNFGNQDSTNNLIGTTDLTFTGDFNLGYTTLEMQDHTLGMSGWLFNGYINNTILHGGLLQNLTSLDNLTIEGTVTIDDYNKFQGSVVVTDTLQSSYDGGGAHYFDLTIDGSLTNNGLIKNQNPGHWLRIFISGDLTSNGSWLNYLTYLNGTEDQHVFLLNDSIIEGPVQFDAVLSTSPFQWFYEGAILESDDFNGETSQVLSWNVAVKPAWYGTYYCETGEGNSRNIIVGQGLFPASNLQATVNCTDVELSWEMQNGNPDSWNVYRDDEVIANVTEMFYTDEMLLPEIEYEYFIIAVYGTEYSEPTPSEYILVQTPENLEPVNFTASNTNTLVQCNWSLPEGCLEPDGYNIYRNGVLQNLLPVTGLEYEDNIPSPGSYEYYVTALYYFGESDPSNIDNVEISGINEPDAEKFKIYPNPAVSVFSLQSAVFNQQPAVVEISNLNGKKLLEEHIPRGTENFKMDVSGLQSGVYLCTIHTQDHSMTKKLIIK